MAKKPVYGNESISSLKGADRVRRRPAESLARMESRDVSIRSLKFYRTPLMKHAKDMARRSQSPVLPTTQLR